MAMDPGDTDRARRAAAEYTDRALQFPNVFGCGVGQRTVAGRQTGEASLVVFVSRKLPLQSLRSDEILPREIITANGRVAIDVVERTPPRLGADNASYRPLRGGCEITPAGSGGSGTLGAVMYDRTDAEVVLLTCNHVLTRAGDRSAIPSNTRVNQPTFGSPIGDTKRIVPWFPPPLNTFDSNWRARVDAGIVSLDATIDARFRVISLGRHPYVVLPPYEGLEVSKRGFVTELTTGTVKEIDTSVVLTDSNGQTVRIGGPGSGFSVQSAEGELFFQRGDSGSLVVDAERGAARGLMFGGDFLAGGISYGCQLSAIMEELQLETPCTGSLNAMFMRVLRRRWLLSSLGKPSLTVADALSKNLKKFRFKYLQSDVAGGVAGGLEQMFQSLASELSESLALDEDFAGLMDLALGDWLVQPTVFDLLEYRLPDDFAERLGRAFDRFHALHPKTTGYEWVVPAFKDCGGARLRDVLARPGPKVRKPKREAA